MLDVDHLEIANCSYLTTLFYPLGNFGQALCIRVCHEDLILTRNSHNCARIAFIQGDSARDSKLIEQTLPQFENNKLKSEKKYINHRQAECHHTLKGRKTLLSAMHGTRTWTSRL